MDADIQIQQAPERFEGVLHDPALLPATKQKREKKAPAALTRDAGKSLLPVARVQRILKADKELPIVAREAVTAISFATEEFIKRIGAASYKQAERERRTTVHRRDVAAVVRRADEFVFLDDIIPFEEQKEQKASSQAPEAETKVKETKKGAMDRFAVPLPHEPAPPEAGKLLDT